MIKSEKETIQALRNLAKSSSEIKAITSNIANVVSICANQIFNLVKNGLQSGFYFLTGHRAQLEALPGENQLAIEHTIDPTNQASIDEKKSVQIYSNFVWLRADYMFCIQRCKASSSDHMQPLKQVNI